MFDSELFTYKMRKATRKIHAVSDALVNAKLALGLNSSAVWAEGLLVFYEIFKFLEEAMKSKKNKNLERMCIEGLMRTDAFEQDLCHYFGQNWKKNYKIRNSVANYLNHLNLLFTNDSDLLMAYIYHLYMGLLSGGQILRKNRELMSKIFPKENHVPGEAVTDFGNFQITELKNELKHVMNSIAETLSEEKRNMLIAESSKVFQLNNMIIRTIKSADKVLINRVVFVFIILVCFFLLYILFYS